MNPQEKAELKNLPIKKVCFFNLINGKHMTENNIEITTSMILAHENVIFHDSGYIILN